MKFEKLSKNNGNKKFVYGFVICAALFITINLLTSKSKFKVDDNIDLAEGTINYTIPDLKLMAVYVKNDEGTFEKKDTVPSDTTYQVVKGEGDNTSYCIDQLTGDKINNVYMKYENGALDIKVTKKGTKCWIYLEKATLLTEEILKKNPAPEEIKSSFTTDVPVSGDASSTKDEGMFKILDYDGEISYYFRGAVEDNYVHFAGFYWRIIRINSDGSIRIIYDGTAPHSNGEASEDRHIEKNVYNNNANDTKYVGYMYGKAEIPTQSYEEANKNEIESDILRTLINWYEQNLLNYDSYIEKDAIFCNDRRSTTKDDSWSNWLAAGAHNSGGFGGDQNATFYGASMRSKTSKSWLSTQYADLSCQPNDRFTPVNATHGNKMISHPIGLITFDEVIMAGGFMGRYNNKYYLYTGSKFFTMSPGQFYTITSNAQMCIIGGNKDISSMYSVSTNAGVRPVINLKANTTFSKGDGTINSPYEII